MSGGNQKVQNEHLLKIPRTTERRLIIYARVSADMETIFATICAAHRALVAMAALWLFSLFFFSRPHTCEFSRRLIYKTLFLSCCCARLVGKTAAMPLAKGRCSIYRGRGWWKLWQTKPHAVLWHKLFASVSNVG
jgi:hypothetical protein